MDGEIWKDVVDYEGYYQVSSLGNVRSLDREVGSSFGTTRKLYGKDFIPQRGKRGYYHVRLSMEGTTKTLKIHQLVAIAFLGHTPSNMKVVVDHIDNDKSNNRADNLQLISQRMNSAKDKKIRGVRKLGNKFNVRLLFEGVERHIGMYETEQEARQKHQEVFDLIETDLQQARRFFKDLAQSRKRDLPKGIHKAATGYYSQIRLDNGSKRIGTFGTLEEARYHRDKCVELKKESPQKVIGYIEDLKQSRKTTSL